MSRRAFIRRISAGSLAALLPRRAPAAPSVLKDRKELRIDCILVQEARGRRETPVAPNAYAGYRGYDVSDRLGAGPGVAIGHDRHGPTLHRTERLI